ncbi:putative bifunctional diguanylate cyclase/phosphodiesterase [Qipengyuania sp. DGS5-3]|uniref:putative bifunctional diguanylate cyclase/phosphodiesterase n=1 Tax=Qipengyuania sp. DGS5-3 TaxID=3349632 RepID=UPI0036D393A6
MARLGRHLPFEQQIRSFTESDSLSVRARNLLNKALYTQPTSLAIGAFNGAVATAAVAWLSGVAMLWALCTVLNALSILRIVLALKLSKSSKNSDVRALERLFDVSAFLCSLILGLFCGAVLIMQLPAPSDILMIANSLAFGIGVCVRNAGRPRAAMGHLMLVALPIAIACLIVGGLAMNLLALTVLLLLPGIGSVVTNLTRVLRQSIENVEDSRVLAHKMQKLARTDSVTGLSNRKGLDFHLDEALLAAKADRQYALLWAALDRFGTVNDRFGHQIGAKALVQMAKRLQEVLPDDAKIARLESAEFIVICPIDSHAQCSEIAAQMIVELAATIRVEGQQIEIGASIGGAVLPDDGVDAGSLMKSADLALYKAKTAGANQFCQFTSELSREQVRKQEIDDGLRTAIERDELAVFFQPIIDLETGRIRSFEALVRWFHPEHGELQPDEFIPIAETSGSIVTLGNWITAQAAKAATSWPEEISLAVNLSPAQIKAPGAALGILNALREAGLDPARLELELTEALILESSSQLRAFVDELSGAGVKFALDDFGTGHASLNQINEWPLSKVKVDRSVVSGPQEGKRSEAIIRAVSQMSQTLGLQVVAEGLETPEQVKAVREAGCTLGQGYHFSRAVPDYLASMLLAKEEEGYSPSGQLRAAG